MARMAARRGFSSASSSSQAPAAAARRAPPSPAQARTGGAAAPPGAESDSSDDSLLGLPGYGNAGGMPARGRQLTKSRVRASGTALAPQPQPAAAGISPRKAAASAAARSVVQHAKGTAAVDALWQEVQEASRGGWFGGGGANGRSSPQLQPPHSPRTDGALPSRWQPWHSTSTYPAGSTYQQLPDSFQPGGGGTPVPSRPQQALLSSGLSPPAPLRAPSPPPAPGVGQAAAGGKVQHTLLMEGLGQEPSFASSSGRSGASGNGEAQPPPPPPAAVALPPLPQQWSVQASSSSQPRFPPPPGGYARSASAPRGLLSGPAHERAHRDRIASLLADLSTWPASGEGAHCLAAWAPPCCLRPALILHAVQSQVWTCLNAAPESGAAHALSPPPAPPPPAHPRRCPHA